MSAGRGKKNNYEESVRNSAKKREREEKRLAKLAEAKVQENADGESDFMAAFAGANDDDFDEDGGQGMIAPPKRRITAAERRAMKKKRKSGNTSSETINLADKVAEPSKSKKRKLVPTTEGGKKESAVAKSKKQKPAVKPAAAKPQSEDGKGQTTTTADPKAKFGEKFVPKPERGAPQEEWDAWKLSIGLDLEDRFGKPKPKPPKSEKRILAQRARKARMGKPGGDKEGQRERWET
jgi:hypothetical protein